MKQEQVKQIYFVPVFGTIMRNPKKFSRCLGTGIQGASIGKYTGTGIPAHGCPAQKHLKLGQKDSGI